MKAPEVLRREEHTIEGVWYDRDIAQAGFTLRHHTVLDLVPNETIDYNPFVEFHRVGKLVGRSEIGVELDDVETWSASIGVAPNVGNGWRGTVVLRPFEIRDCGCVANFGGYVVRDCVAHTAPEPPRQRRDYDPPVAGWTDKPDLEQEHIYREVTQ